MTEKKQEDSRPDDHDRRFRRYHRARARQAKNAREDTNFFRAVYSLAGVGAALAIGLAVFGMTGGSSISGMEGLAQPWIGSLTKLEALGIGFIGLLAAMYFWRVRKRK